MNYFPFLFVAALYVFGPISVSVYPPIDSSPGAFRARAIIEKHADNRLLVMEVDGPEYKSSQWVIEGAQSQRVFQWERLELRGVGEYIARATLTRIIEGKEKKLVATATFRVTGFDPYAPSEW